MPYVVTGNWQVAVALAAAVAIVTTAPSIFTVAVAVRTQLCGRYNTEHKGTQHNDIEHNDTQHN